MPPSAGAAGTAGGVRPPPFLVLAAGDDLESAAAALRGWTVHRGLTLPAQPWDLGPARLVAVGPLPDLAAARAALLCAVRGTGLVVGLDPAAPFAAGFRADLRSLEPAPAVAPPPAGDLSPDQRDILELLAAGNSIAEAARLRFLSLRTANRRVAEARDALGVATTREAVLAYVKLRG
jgi:DNA-binding CsgD family transcriptional regulator